MISNGSRFIALTNKQTHTYRQTDKHYWKQYILLRYHRVGGKH